MSDVSRDINLDWPELPDRSGPRSMNRVLEEQDKREIKRRVRALHDGQTVTIPAKLWDAFVKVSEGVDPGPQDWRCIFSNGNVEITKTR